MELLVCEEAKHVEGRSPEQGEALAVQIEEKEQPENRKEEDMQRLKIR
jgi:hypothetical protein